MDFFPDDFQSQFTDILSKLSEKLVGWVEAIILNLPNFFLSVVILLFFIGVARLIGRLISRLLSRVSQYPSINNIIRMIVTYTIIVIGVFTALETLGYKKMVTSLLAGAGIVGLALSFAFQDIATNLVSGFIIAIRQPFKEGDLIETNSQLGFVNKISLRTTDIVTFQGQNIMIPNKEIFEKPITLYSTGYRRVDLPVGISYGEDLQTVEEITIRAIQSLDFIAKDRDVILYWQEFGSSSINFIVVFWIQFPGENFFKARSEAIKAIKAVYDEEGITIPFPIRTLDFGIKGGKTLDMMLKNKNGSSSED